MNDDQLSTRTALAGPVDSTRLDRRKAMKAALGGAAAGAAFVAPKIAGFSVAPDYAAAASAACGANGTTNGTTGGTSVGMDHCYVNCWGNKNANWGWDCDCLSDNSCCSDVTTTLKLANSTNGPFVLAFTRGGRVGNSGRWNYNINGIDPPFQSCNVQVNANCNFNGAANTTHNNNGSRTENGAYCNDSGNSNKTITVNMTCTCT